MRRVNDPDRHNRGKRGRRLPAMLVWLGAGLSALVLIVAIVQPGMVLGLMRPSAASGTTPVSQTAASSPVQSPTARSTTGGTPATVPTTATTPAAVAPAATAPTTVKPSTTAAKPLPTPTPVPTKPKPSTTATTKPAVINWPEGASRLSPLAVCCGGKKTPAPVTRQKDIQVARIVNGRQQATITVDSYGYSPGILVVQKGVETTLGFDLKQPDSCNDQLFFTLFDRKINLAAGQKVPAFKPDGDFAFSCWMGMQGVYVKVVPDIGNVDLDQIEQEVAAEFDAGNVDCH